MVPVDAARLEAALRGELWTEWDPLGEGRISRAAFCAERGLLRWLAEHLAELQEERARGSPPKLEEDRVSWFHHWARPGADEMGKGEVLRAVLKSAGTSSLEATEVAAWREWIERCWLMWDRDGSEKITLGDFCREGGFADMMLQQSGLANAKRIVRRMELEPHNSAVLVACCQQLVECAVGVLPEDPISRWPVKAYHKLCERASLPHRDEYEAVLREGALQVVRGMQNNPGSAKHFAWSCRALAALSFVPLQAANGGLAEPPDLEQTLDVLLGQRCGRIGELHQHMAPTDRIREPLLWRLVVQGLINLLPSYDSCASGSLPPAPGALREAGLCACGALSILAHRAGPEVGDDICNALVALLGSRRGCGSAMATTSDGSVAGPMTSLVAWIHSALDREAGGAPSPTLIAWVAAAVTALAADGRKLAGVLLGVAPVPQFIPCLTGLLAALGESRSHRPPTTARNASRVAQALLRALHRLPNGDRAGAGGARADGEAIDGTQKVRTRDGRFAVGDAIRMNPDVAQAKRGQEPAEHYGGWCDRMAFCLDSPGRIVEIPRRTPRMPEVLRISHGALGCWCWNVDIVAGIIPDAGLLPFEEGEFGPGVALTIGDEVRVAVKAQEAKALQVNHGGWNERMAQCCGRVGRLEAIDKSGRMKVLVPGVGAFVWNPAALRAPHAQRWEAALCERIAGPLGGTLPVALLAAMVAVGSRLDESELRAVIREVQKDANASSSDTSCTTWTTLIMTALVVNPIRASQLMADSVSVTLGDASRSEALTLVSKEFCAGTVHDMQPNIGVLHALEAWWTALPASEKRARGI